MSTVSTPVVWDKQALLQWQQKSPLALSPEWSAWQQQHIQNFLELGLPTRHHENWKYTPVSTLDDLDHFIRRQEKNPIDISSFVVEGALRVILVDGVYREDLSDVTKLDEGIRIADLSAVVNTQTQSLLSLNSTYQTPFTHLNAGLLGGGLFITVEKNKKIDSPIHVLSINTATSESANHIRVILQADAGSEVTLLEEHYGNDSCRYFHNVVTQINVGENAAVEYYKLQREGSQACHIANTVVTQERSSQVKTYVVTLGADLGREDLNFVLNGEGAETTLTGLYSVSGEQHIDHHTRVDHNVACTSSNQVYKGLANESSQAVFNGKVFVAKHTKQIEAHQSNANLLLGKSARINAKPELEIYADDVKCSHGATIGQLDENALFYLRCRGISKPLAEHMLTMSFADEVIESLPQPSIKAYMRNCAINRLVGRLEGED
jgi:Fe-S cluster assembly protein SufD